MTSSRRPSWLRGTRRSLGLLAAAATLGIAMAVPAVSQVGAPASIPVASGSASGMQAPLASPIKNVVVLYMENHTFDNLLGFWCDGHPQRCPDGGMPSSVRLSDGTVVTPRT